MNIRMMHHAAAAVIALGSLVAPLGAQSQEEPPSPTGEWTAEMVPVDPFAAPAPFGPGEHLVYRVKVGIISAGYGFMSVLGTEDVRDNPSYRVEMGIKGGVLGLNVNDVYRSWFDVSTFQTWRYIRDLHEINYKSFRHYEMYPERMVWEREDIEESGPLLSALPLDEIAFIYFIRALPLEVGKTYTFSRYFKEDGNPVVIKVLRKDQREIDGVVYPTIVVKPLIQSSGLFSEGGDAEMHISDDHRRILVYLKSNIPKFPGSLTLELHSVQEGFPLNPESRAEALEAREARAQDGPQGG